MTLRLRLSLLISLIILSGFALFGSLAYTLFTRGQNEQLERLNLLLMRDLSRAQNLVQQPSVGERLSEANQARLTQQFVSTRGVIIIPPGGGQALPLYQEPTIDEIENEHFIVASVPWYATSGTRLGTIRSALDISDIYSSRRNLLRSLLVSGLLIALLAAILGLSILQRALFPLASLAAQARKIDPAKPTIASYKGPEDEVSDLAKALNSAIEGIRVRQEAERASLAEIAHELAAPLSLVAGHLSSLGKHVKDDRLEAAKDAANELLYTSQDLLTLARGELERPLDMKVFDLSDVAYKVARAYPGVKANLTENTMMAGNPERLTQLVRNLVRNAVQASGSTDKVSVDLYSENLEHVLLVKDKGPGIPEADLAHIFDRFYSKRGGVGVGLSVVKHITLQHEGSIEASSKLGLGTSFKLSFPSLQSRLEDESESTGQG